MYYNRSFGEQDRFWSFPNWLLALLRFLAVSLIAFLLLSPFVKSYYKEVQKPVVAVALDNSASVALNRDSAYYRDTFPGQVQALVNDLKAEYEVQPFTFGQDVKADQSLNFQEDETNLSKPIESIYDKFYNRNLGAVILATDGIYNKGRNPLTAAQKLQPPVYPVALGDTVPPQDWRLPEVRHNDIVYAGSKFPVEVRVEGEGMRDQRQTVQIQRNGETLFQEAIRATTDAYDTTIRTLLTIDEPGLKTYKASVEPQAAEISKANNTKSFYIEALKSKRQVAIIANQPHPDIGAVKDALQSRKRYQVETFTLEQWQGANKSVEGYNVVIFHQLPGTGQASRKLVRQVKQEAIPSLYMIGSGTSLNTLNQLDIGISINQKGGKPNQVRPVLEQNFNAFTLSEDLKELLRQLPPAKAPYGDYSLNMPHSTLLSQKIGEVKSDKPLLTFLQQPNYKVGVLSAVGIWRWYLSEYRIRGEHQAVPEMLTKTIQYLAVDAQKRQFRLVDQENRYQENERIQFEAEFYNESYEPVDDAAIDMDIVNQAGKTYEFNFQPAGGGYRLEAGYLPPGKYDFQAEARYGGDAYTRSGSFVVEATNKELLTTVADHSLLKNLADESNGKVFYPGNLQEIPNKLKAAGDLKNVASQEYRLQELIHNKLLFFVILVFLGGEWFLRKYYGGY